jgi:hypothetical protein
MTEISKADGWTYRVIEFTSEDGTETWRSINEVYYANGVPRGYSERGADVTWYTHAGDTDETPGLILDRMREALSKPVLTISDFNHQK